MVEEGLSVLSNYLLDQLRELTSQHTPYSDILPVLRSGQQVVQEGLSVLSNYLLNQ